MRFLKAVESILGDAESADSVVRDGSSPGIEVFAIDRRLRRIVTM